MTQEPNIFPYIARLLQGAEVVWKPLGEVCEFSNTGVDKKTIEGEKKVRLLNFVDVFHKQYITKETPTMIVSASDKKILDCNILKGDVFITPSSEILDEIGYSATAIEDIKGAVYSYHIMRLRVYNKEILHPEYLAYLFSSNSVRKQIRIKAQGITRFGLTLPRWKSIQIPLPPLSVQQEIVRILDKFTQLEAELEAELEGRKRQYEYYRNKLLTFSEIGGGTKVEWKTLGEVGEVTKLAGFEFTNYVKYNDTGKIIALRGLNVKGSLDLSDVKYIDESDFSKLNRSKLYINDMLFTYVGTVGSVALIPENDKYYLAPNVARIRFLDRKINPRFMFHYFQSDEFKKKQINRYLGSSSMKNLTMENIRKFQIPLPPLEEQQRIATILDKFDTLVNSISEGLPKEIALRRKQYEYYREQLLRF